MNVLAEASSSYQNKQTSPKESVGRAPSDLIYMYVAFKLIVHFGRQAL